VFTNLRVLISTGGRIFNRGHYILLAFICHRSASSRLSAFYISLGQIPIISSSHRINVGGIS
jgi:hypothetical protein